MRLANFIRLTYAPLGVIHTPTKTTNQNQQIKINIWFEIDPQFLHLAPTALSSYPLSIAEPILPSHSKELWSPLSSARKRVSFFVETQ